MTKERARQLLSHIGHQDIKLNCDRCSPDTITVEELFSMFQALMKEEKIECDTCRFQWTRGYECKECRGHSYWEEKEAV